MVASPRVPTLSFLPGSMAFAEAGHAAMQRRVPAPRAAATLRTTSARRSATRLIACAQHTDPRATTHRAHRIETSAVQNDRLPNRRLK